jgi:hypothetical protein
MKGLTTPDLNFISDYINSGAMLSNVQTHGHSTTLTFIYDTSNMSAPGVLQA